jgi:hypothetical protein
MQPPNKPATTAPAAIIKVHRFTLPSLELIRDTARIPDAPPCTLHVGSSFPVDSLDPNNLYPCVAMCKFRYGGPAGMTRRQARQKTPGALQAPVFTRH